jgi:hypothetical protein
MDSQSPVRTYGGWRRSRGMGLFGLGPAQTLLVLSTLTVLVIAATVDVALLAVAAVPSVAVLGLVLVRIDGVPVAAGLVQRWRWWIGTTRGHTSYRSGIMVAGPHAWGLPGVLAPTTLIAVTDPAGDYGIVHNQRLGTMTATLRCAATSTWLADPDEGANWVASWGSWLANLGYLPTVSHVAVTVDSAPDPGTRLADHIARRIVPHAPPSAQLILRQLVSAAPAASADVETRVSITFNPAASPTPARDDAEAVTDLSRTLPGLQDSLSACGLAVLGRATAADLVGIVRTAFDPAMRGDVSRMLDVPGGLHLAQWLDWETCGPVTAEEHLDRYVHDTGVSVSFAWHEAPRQNVHADVLARLLAPGPYPKRVAVIYRPMSAGEAGRVVEREVNAAAFHSALRRTQRRDESARDAADRERALRAAREEATGAGVGLMSLFVTVTVTDPDQIDRAVADIEARADGAKIRLRRMRASQAAGFATTLPCGICPPQLARAWPR